MMKSFQYIATNIKSNIRELEGALNRITAMSSLEHREITVELAQEALKGYDFTERKTRNHPGSDPSDRCRTLSYQNR